MDLELRQPDSVAQAVGTSLANRSIEKISCSTKTEIQKSIQYDRSRGLGKGEAADPGHSLRIIRASGFGGQGQGTHKFVIVHTIPSYLRIRSLLLMEP